MRFTFKPLSSFLTFNFSLVYYPRSHKFRNSLPLLTGKHPPVCPFYTVLHRAASEIQRQLLVRIAETRGSPGREKESSPPGRAASDSGEAAATLAGGLLRCRTWRLEFRSILRVRRRPVLGLELGTRAPIKLLCLKAKSNHVDATHCQGVRRLLAC